MSGIFDRMISYFNSGPNQYASGSRSNAYSDRNMIYGRSISSPPNMQKRKTRRLSTISIDSQDSSSGGNMNEDMIHDDTMDTDRHMKSMNMGKKGTRSELGDFDESLFSHLNN